MAKRYGSGRKKYTASELRKLTCDRSWKQLGTRQKEAVRQWRSEKGAKTRAALPKAYKKKAGPSPAFQKQWKEAGGRFFKGKKGWEAELSFAPRADARDEMFAAQIAWADAIQKEAKAYVGVEQVLNKSAHRTWPTTDLKKRPNGYAFVTPAMQVDRLPIVFEAADRMNVIAEESGLWAKELKLRVAWGKRPNWRTPKKRK